MFLSNWELLDYSFSIIFQWVSKSNLVCEDRIIMKIYTIRIVSIFWSCLVCVCIEWAIFFFLLHFQYHCTTFFTLNSISKKPSRPKNISTNFKSISQEKFIVFNLYISQILPIWIGILFSLTSVTSNWEGKTLFQTKIFEIIGYVRSVEKIRKKSWKIQTNTKLNIIDGKWFDSTRFSYSSGNEKGSRIWEILGTFSTEIHNRKNNIFSCTSRLKRERENSL